MPRLRHLHRLTVDAYAVQHPGRPSPKSKQSVAVHLMRLHLILELGFDDDAAAKAMPRLARQTHCLHWLEPPPSLGNKTVVDVWNTTNAHQHTEAAREWARSAWQAWAPHYVQILQWLPPEFTKNHGENLLRRW